MITKGDSQAGAVFSDCEEYRFRLWRRWGDGNRVMFLMLNPSTATHEVVDPTVAKCIRFAKSWGYSGIEVCNIFALRSTDPSEIRVVRDPIGERNDSIIADVAQIIDDEGSHVICAWGQHGLYQGRGEVVRKMLIEKAIPLNYLKMGANNQPWHPLYLKGDTMPTYWEHA